MHIQKIRPGGLNTNILRMHIETRSSWERQVTKREREMKVDFYLGLFKKG